MTGDALFAALHELIGKCGHCGKRNCPDREEHSTLPDRINLDVLQQAVRIVAAADEEAKRPCASCDGTGLASRGVRP